MPLLLDICTFDCFSRSSKEKKTYLPRTVRLRKNVRPTAKSIKIECWVGNLVVRPARRGKKVRILTAGTVHMCNTSKLSLVHHRPTDGGNPDVFSISGPGSFGRVDIETVIEVPSNIRCISISAIGDILVEELSCQELNIEANGNITCYAFASQYDIELAGSNSLLFAPNMSGSSTAALKAFSSNIVISPKNAKYVDVSEFNVSYRSIQNHHVEQEYGYPLKITGSTCSESIVVC